MEMPMLSRLVRILAVIGAVIGCAIGAAIVIGSFAAFQYGLLAGLFAMLGGIWYILGALAGLGIIYCFLAIVEAQIDTRNAVLEYITHAKRQSRKAADAATRLEPSV